MLRQCMRIICVVRAHVIIFRAVLIYYGVSFHLLIYLIFFSSTQFVTTNMYSVYLARVHVCLAGRQDWCVRRLCR